MPAETQPLSAIEGTANHVDRCLANIAAQSLTTDESRRHGRFSPAVTALSHASDRFRTHAPIAELWWWHLVYLVCEERGAVVLQEPLYHGDLLAGWPAKDVCVELFTPVPDGLLPSLRKFRSYPLPAGAYRRLVEALRSEKRARILVHAETVTPDLIDIVTSLPEEALSTGLAEVLLNKGRADAFRYLLDILLAIFPEEDHRRIFEAVRRIEDPGSIRKWFQRWLQKAEFPSPPWPGNELLTPIATPKQLVSLARSYRNCLRDYVPSVICGLAYFYEWKGGAPMVIELLRDPIIGWVVDEIQGLENRLELTPEARADILEQFQNAGIRQRPSLTGVGSWIGDPRFLFD